MTWTTRSDLDDYGRLVTSMSRDDYGWLGMTGLTRDD